jgi:hypothetical protein
MQAGKGVNAPKKNFTNSSQEQDRTNLHLKILKPRHFIRSSAAKHGTTTAAPPRSTIPPKGRAKE